MVKINFSLSYSFIGLQPMQCFAIRIPCIRRMLSPHRGDYLNLQHHDKHQFICKKRSGFGLKPLSVFISHYRCKTLSLISCVLPWFQYWVPI